MKTAPRQIFISTHSKELLSDEGIAPDEVLLLMTTEEGTQVRLGASDEEIVQELDAGFTVAEVVLSRTEPPAARQLSFLGE